MGFRKQLSQACQTQAQYADMIILLCILKANKNKKNKTSLVRSLHFNLLSKQTAPADENSYYAFYNLLRLSSHCFSFFELVLSDTFVFDEAYT